MRVKDIITRIHVRNMTSDAGRDIPNQFVIKIRRYDDTYDRYFQSYNSIICATISGTTYLDETYWNYSRTTSRYRNRFLGCTTEVVKKRIKDGTYKLVDLNKSSV